MLLVLLISLVISFVAISSTKYLRAKADYQLPYDGHISFYSDFDDNFGFELDDHGGSEFDATTGTSYYSPEFIDSASDSNVNWPRRRKLDNSGSFRTRSHSPRSSRDDDTDHLETDEDYLDEYYAGGTYGLEENIEDDDYGDDSYSDDAQSSISYPYKLFMGLIDQIKDGITANNDCNNCILSEDKCNNDHIVCPLEGNYQPVCGCDGNTYENACSARYFHCNSHWTDGPCAKLLFH